MSFASKVPTGVRRVLRLPRSRARLMREMDEEVRAHLAMRIDDLRALGMNAADAEAEALRRFGDSDEYRTYAERRVARAARWGRLVEWLDEWSQDVRFANRQFRRNAGFTLLAVLTLALGIGANTAIFSVVHRLLIAPLPYPAGNRLVKLMVEDGNDLQPPDSAIVTAWRERAHSFEMFAAISVDGWYLQGGARGDTLVAVITSNFLDLLGEQPALGRNFTVQDERHGSSRVAMISYGKWQREFGGRPDVLGSTIPIGTDRYTVIGVTPPDVSIPMAAPAGVSGHLTQGDPAIWLPGSIDSIAGDRVFAKLRPGVSARQASRELQSILTDVARPSQRTLRARAMRAQDFLDPREAQTVEVLFVAVGVLLVIACANIANLLMSRAWARRREFAVRSALGAGRGRLARQVLTESTLLGIIGGIVGLGVAWETLKIIVALRPPSLEQLDGLGLESAMLMWSAGISVITGILFGSAPALFAGGRSVGDVLRSETRGASGGTAARRVRSGLIVLEIALSLVLLVGAGLLVRSFLALQRVPLGFEPHGLVAADIPMLLPRAWSAELRSVRRNELLERLRAIPGVTDASIGMMPGLGWGALSTIETDRDASGNTRSVAQYSATFISPNYFRLAKMPLLAGRVPDSLTWPRGFAIDSTMAQEVVVNRSFARRFWPDGKALGARLHERDGKGGWRQSYTVVGVVDDIRLPGRQSAIPPSEIYSPVPARFSQAPVLLRTTLPAAEITTSVRRVVDEFNRTLTGSDSTRAGVILREITIGDTYLAESLAPTRFAMALLVAFSALALVLSGVGLYGVIAYSVTQRTREIGVRIALGAEPGSVRRLVVGGGLRLAALGVAIGVVAAAASTRVLAHLLYGVTPADPMTFATVATLVVAIAFAASVIPAGRAMRVDPIEALRAE